jgi:hypothetical protein
LFTSQALIDHGAATMEAIDETLTELDNADDAHKKILQLGKQHKNWGIEQSDILVSFIFLFCKI